MAIDTPNARVCRLQQADFIDPDHKVEYLLDDLRAKVERAGFEVLTERGLNWGGPAVARGQSSTLAPWPATTASSTMPSRATCWRS